MAYYLKTDTRRSSRTRETAYPRFSRATLGYRLYNPGTGRWLSRDPIGDNPGCIVEDACSGLSSAEQGNHLFAYVQNMPTIGIDPLGLYLYIWKGNWLPWQKEDVCNSVSRVSKRCKDLIKQFDDNISSLSKSECYTELVKNLQKTKKILEGMIDEMDDPKFKLEVYKRVYPNHDPVAEYLDGPLWRNDELRLDPTWWGRDDQDEVMAHEISHGQGTEHDWTDDPYGKNAEAFAILMRTDKENWQQFVVDKMKIDGKAFWSQRK